VIASGRARTSLNETSPEAPAKLIAANLSIIVSEILAD